ncbi:MAG: hypothetical protein HY736_16410, partial [Verrucomicrobia bacterium]|nr:hypothetical protein [Verrucomicrobiota bacterium]
MSNAPSLGATVAAHRPPGAPAREAKTLGEIAHRWRDELARVLTEIDAEALALGADELAELAVAMCELAEDLHTDGGLWRGLEAGNRVLFDTPLPLLWRTGDSPLAPFDARRFQFFLHSVWRHFKPDRIMSPMHPGFVAVACRAGTFFAGAFAGRSRASSVTAFLGTANVRGWDVKRKLVWLGTHGFLFRFAHADYLARNPPKDADIIGTTDDFLCQECTAWSGFGALDLLAAVLDLPEADRAALRGWHERHAAFYRVDTLHTRGVEIDTMAVVNLINDQPYSVRMEIPRERCPFVPGLMVFGSLVPWRGEWYWSGGQKTYPQVPPDFSAIKRSMVEKNASIVYRYRPDLAERARQSAARHHADFVRFYGSDFAVFADGLTAAAAQQRHWREQVEAKMGADTPAFLAKHGLDRTGPKLSWPKKLIECRRGVAVFYHEGEGVEMMADFDVLRSALGKSHEALSVDEADTLQAFVESSAISPAFVQRVIREHGSAGIAALYYL